VLPNKPFCCTEKIFISLKRNGFDELLLVVEKILSKLVEEGFIQREDKSWVILYYMKQWIWTVIIGAGILALGVIAIISWPYLLLYQ